jgi:hypothetical protein
MLYLNAYNVFQAFGGKEEGNWYYDVGTPIASIPIHTKRMAGFTYIMIEGVPETTTCYYCKGTGQVQEEDPALPGDLYMALCKDCGEVPEGSPESIGRLILTLQEMFKDEIGRREELRICLERKFAEPFPTEKPTYE